MNPKLLIGLRILLGLFMLIFGLDKFAPFLELPPIPGDGGELMTIYARSGFLQLIGVLEVLAGLALLTNRFVPLAVIITIAIMFNAFVLHMLYDPPNAIGAVIGLLLSLGIIYGNKERFSSLWSV